MLMRNPLIRGQYFSVDHLELIVLAFPSKRKKSIHPTVWDETEMMMISIDELKEGV